MDQNASADDKQQRDANWTPEEASERCSIGIFSCRSDFVYVVCSDCSVPQTALSKRRHTHAIHEPEGEGR